jgi:hypothetical protein
VTKDLNRLLPAHARPLSDRDLIDEIIESVLRRYSNALRALSDIPDDEIPEEISPA